MDPETVLRLARSAVAEVSHRTTDLLRGLPDLQARIPGATWSVREAAVHLVNFAAMYQDIAVGMPSPRLSVARDHVAWDNDRRIADVAETDPDKVAALVADTVDRFLDVTTGRPATQTVTFHCGFPLNLDALVCIYLGEVLLHGYDIATAVAAPWPIDPMHAQLILYGYGPCFGLVADKQRTRGLTAGYGIDLRDGPAFTVRFVDGEYRLEDAASGPVDATISADPVAFLMVGSGRLRVSAAIALGLLTVGGDRPELAVGFPDLFQYP